MYVGVFSMGNRMPRRKVCGDYSRLRKNQLF